MSTNVTERAVAARRRTAIQLLQHAEALGFDLRAVQKGARIDSNSLKNMKKAAPQTQTLYKVARFLEQEQRKRSKLAGTASPALV